MSDNQKLAGDIAVALQQEAYWRMHRNDSPEHAAKYEAAKKRAALGLDLQKSIDRADAAKRK